MPYSDLENPRKPRPDDQAFEAAFPVRPGFVVVVGRSPVTLIVLSRIVERARMRPVSESPETAGRMIEECRPAIVVLDGGADLRDCDAALDSILAQKRLTGGAAPFVILLTPNNYAHRALEAGGTIDAMVAKPITPERLQPLIEQIRDRAAHL
ncbi:MAG: response regulator [Mesorhizobium sp.]|nr:response regulator [Mesorhizobium sp.]